MAHPCGHPLCKVTVAPVWIHTDLASSWTVLTSQSAFNVKQFASSVNSGPGAESRISLARVHFKSFQRISERQFYRRLWRVFKLAVAPREGLEEQFSLGTLISAVHSRFVFICCSLTTVTTAV